MYTTTRAVKTFVSVASQWHQATISLAAAATVVFIRASRDADFSIDTTSEELRKAVAETGLQRSQVYRYVGIGRKLWSRLKEDHPDIDGVPQAIIYQTLDARTPTDAVVEVVAYLHKVGITSADQLDVYLGATPRGFKAAARMEPRQASAGAITATVEGSPTRVVEALADTPRKAFGELLRELCAELPIPQLRLMAQLSAEVLSEREGHGKRRVRHAGRNQEKEAHGAPLH